MKNVFKIVLLIIGVTIGAGFASGREIYLFFNQFGINGFIGLCISNLLFLYIIYKTFLIIKKNNIKTYNDFLNKIIGKNKLLNKILIIIINAFLLIGFYVMIAAFGSYFYQELKINNYIGTSIGAVICYSIFKKNINGIVKINEILVPIIICLIIFLGIININYKNVNIERGTNLSKAIFYSIIYVSYNSIALIPIIISIKDYIRNKKNIFIISIFSCILLFILGVIIFILLFSININNVEMPLIYIASANGKIFKYLYGLIILMAILTSAIAEGYGILNNLTKNKNEYKIMNFFICISSIIISKIGFTNLVNTLYPIFGILSLIQVFFIFLTKP